MFISKILTFTAIQEHQSTKSAGMFHSRTFIQHSSGTLSSGPKSGWDIFKSQLQVCTVYIFKLRFVTFFYFAVFLQRALDPFLGRFYWLFDTRDSVWLCAAYTLQRLYFRCRIHSTGLVYRAGRWRISAIISRKVILLSIWLEPTRCGYFNIFFYWRGCSRQQRSIASTAVGCKSNF